MVDRWTSAWFAACVVLAAHVVDEVVHGSYGLYSDVGWLLDAAAPWLDLPPFREEVWLVNISGALAVLFGLTVLVWLRRGPMAVASFALAAFVTANGVLHLLGAVALGAMIPGTWTAPLMILTGLFLFVSVERKNIRR